MGDDIEFMKSEAAIAADQIEINWKKLENPEYRADFERTLKRAMLFVPELEGMYQALLNGESVANPGTHSSLPYADLEKYSDLVAEELFNGYVLRSLYHKYEAIENVMRAALDNEN